MLWVLFALGTVMAWGIYGPTLHKGQALLGHPMRALLCVGFAYFLIGVLAPVAILIREGNFNGFTAGGIGTATMAGALGAIGALCIIFAFKSGGSPTFVMPLIFAGAPVVTVLVTMATHPPKTAPSPMLYLGFLMAAAGAGMVLYFKPSS